MRCGSRGIGSNDCCAYPCEISFDPIPRDPHRISDEELHAVRSYTIQPVNWVRRTHTFTCRNLVRIVLGDCEKQDYGWSTLCRWDILSLHDIGNSENPSVLANHTGTARIVSGNRATGRRFLLGEQALNLSPGSPPEYQVRLQPALSPVEEFPRNEVGHWLLRNVRVPLPVPPQ